MSHFKVPVSNDANAKWGNCVSATRTLVGDEGTVRSLARELWAVGLPTGMRQVDTDSFSIEIDLTKLGELEKIHVSEFISVKALKQIGVKS